MWSDVIINYRYNVGLLYRAYCTRPVCILRLCAQHLGSPEPMHLSGVVAAAAAAASTATVAVVMVVVMVVVVVFVYFEAVFVCKN